MTEPIPFKVTRYRCPHCPRTASSKARMVDHIGRCWTNPEARGCKTCAHYAQNYEGAEFCAVGVDLAVGDGATSPIVHCDLWEASPS